MYLKRGICERGFYGLHHYGLIREIQFWSQQKVGCWGNCALLAVGSQAPEISDTLYPLPRKERRRNICSGLRRVGGRDRV